MKCKYVHLDKTCGHKTACPHDVWKDGQFCVFHTPDGRAKTEDFKTALLQLVETANASETAVDIDMKGFVFPKLDLRGTRFRWDADFRGAIFLDHVDFRKSEFLGQADFHTTEFRSHVNFCWCFFAKNIRFLGTVFAGRAIFSACKFRGTVVFHGCKFSDFAAWQASKFNLHVVFHQNALARDADFRQAMFFAGVDFSNSIFSGRTDFQDTRFHEEVTFSNTHLAFLKKLNCRRAMMNGAVLHTAQLWETNTLSYYSFRNAFLISVNLAGKQLVDCDFTGAVFKAVLTAGWKPDRRTIDNTKYIFTDYRTSTSYSDDGTKLRAYHPVPDSRVPAEGYFGEGEHGNFTLADYLREPLRLNMALSVPPLLRTAVTNYLQLFADFVKVTQGIPVELRTRLEGSKMRVEFLANTEEDLQAIKESFTEYQRNTGKNFEQLKLSIVFNKNTSELERQLFLMKLESQLNQLRTELTYTKALLSKSDENRALLAKLVAASRSPDSLLQPLQLPADSSLTVASQPSTGARLVFSYSHKDEELRDELDAHLSALQREGLIIPWYDRKISPGQSWRGVIDAHFRQADVILLLISSDFIKSDYCYAEEMTLALDRHKNGEARVVPVCLRPCDWHTLPFGYIQGVPKNMKPVTSWSNRDEAWCDVAISLRASIEEIAAAKQDQGQAEESERE